MKSAKPRRSFFEIASASFILFNRVDVFGKRSGKDTQPFRAGEIVARRGKPSEMKP
jgi:hypothetical protein